MVATFGGGCHGGVPFLGAMAAVAGVPLLGAMVVWHGGGGRDGALNHGYIRYTMLEYIMFFRVEPQIGI